MLEVYSAHPSSVVVEEAEAETAATVVSLVGGPSSSPTSSTRHPSSSSSSSSTTTATNNNNNNTTNNLSSKMLPRRSLQKSADSELSICIDDFGGSSPTPSTDPPRSNNNRRMMMGDARTPSYLSNVMEHSQEDFSGGFSLSSWDNNNNKSGSAAATTTKSTTNTNTDTNTGGSSKILPRRSLQKSADSELSICIDDFGGSPTPSTDPPRSNNRRPSYLSNVMEHSQEDFSGGFSLSSWDNNTNTGGSRMLPRRSLQKSADSELSLGIDELGGPSYHDPRSNNNNRFLDRAPSGLSNVIETSERGSSNFGRSGRGGGGPGGFSLSCWDKAPSIIDLDGGGSNHYNGGYGGADDDNYGDLGDLPSFQGKYVVNNNNNRRNKNKNAPPTTKNNNNDSGSMDSFGSFGDLTDDDDDDEYDQQQQQQQHVQLEEEIVDTPELSEKLRKWGFRNGRKRTIRFNAQDKIHKIETPSVEEYPLCYYCVHELQTMMDEYKLEEKQAAEQARMARRALALAAAEQGETQSLRNILSARERQQQTQAQQQEQQANLRRALERNNGARGLSSTD